eukprot:4731216-Prorocentrum_lima.AAC.1
MDWADVVGVTKMLAKSHIKGRHTCHQETPVNIVVLELSGDGVDLSEDWKSGPPWHVMMKCSPRQ